MTVKDLLYNISFVTKPTAYCFANVFNVFFSKEDNCVYFYNENEGQKEIPISSVFRYKYKVVYRKDSNFYSKS